MESSLPIKTFIDRKELRKWLEENSATSQGVRVRLYKVGSHHASISFHDLLEEGLCFGWSESKRYSFDEVSYVQVFTPRRGKGTKSIRNQLLVERLIREERMTERGLLALHLNAGGSK